MSRTPGARDKNPDSAARKAATSKPRLMLKPTDYERLREAKSRLVDVLTGPGIVWLVQIIQEGPPRWERLADGTRLLVEGNQLFEWAMNFAADRGGLKREQGLDVSQPGGFTITVNDARGGLGWPVVAVGGGVDESGDRPSVAN